MGFGMAFGRYGGDGNLLNRFGSLDEPAPSSVQHSGTSSGKGVHSSASSSIDSTGKVTYHVQAGKF
ncbi:Protein of unknown function [Gryllus bimaculatus]|nr:Protein of unknown function [Gryllus bimaculatus]